MITHPVISAFIRKKWEKVLRVYIGQGICYFLFVVFYTAFIYYLFTTGQSENYENLTQTTTTTTNTENYENLTHTTTTTTITTTQTKPSENLPTNQEITENKVGNNVFWLIGPLIFLIILHALREDFKITKY